MALKKNEILVNLKNMGVGYDYYKDLKFPQLKKFYNQIVMVKIAYKDILGWENIPRELNIQILKGYPNTRTIDDIIKDLKTHSENCPSDIGKK